MLRQGLNEEAKLDAIMQGLFQSKRGLNLYNDISETEELLSLPLQAHRPVIKQASTSSFAHSSCCSDVDSDNECKENLFEAVSSKPYQEEYDLFEKYTYKILDASHLGDLPARYVICGIEKHQLPVIGVYVDRRIVPGFKYRVRPLPEVGKNPTSNKCMFDNRALVLRSIGRGYSRRLTFEADNNRLNDNENYFWSDNRPEGYAFELEVLSEGDKFTIFDVNGEAQGTLDVVKNEAHQFEVEQKVGLAGIEKRAKVRFTGKVEFFETGVAKPTPLAGVAVCLKAKGAQTAQIVKICNVIIKRNKYVLKPGIQKIHRRFTVRGKDINDVPTKYSMSGLEPYEIPVVGTYVDPRIIPGFHYKIRPNDRKEHLFNGRSLKLISIGMGYAKRLTFESDSAIRCDNFFWSDSHPDGLGLEPRAIHKNMKFLITNGDQVLGEAIVFRADNPQREERMEKVELPSGKFAIEKYIHIDVTCNIKIASLGWGASNVDEEFLTRVYGLAVVRKDPGTHDAQVVRVEHIGFDSQLNVVFAQTHTELIFLPQH